MQHQLTTLKNGLTVITIDLPHLDSVTTMVAVGAGSRNESRKNMGIAHFFEHMFFKGSRKYPSALEISTLIDGVGAINNAFTSKEFTAYYVKSAAKHINLAVDIISSGLQEPILSDEEIEREKGVIIEEIRMYQDTPHRHVVDLFFELVFGNVPMGWNIAGEEEIVRSLSRSDFVEFIKSHYSPQNMALVFAGKTNGGAYDLAEEYFGQMPLFANEKPIKFQAKPQSSPKVNIFYKKTDQAHVILGGLGYHRKDPRRYALALLTSILGEGMSSRLFIQVRERRGLAYHVSADIEDFRDTGLFLTYAGLKLEKAEEGVKVIKEQLDRLKVESVPEDELKKAKEMQRGHMAIREESTNFLAQFYGLQWVVDLEVITPQEYLAKIDAVTAEDIKEVAKDLFDSNRLNLQVIAPLKNVSQFEKILKG